MLQQSQIRLWLADRFHHHLSKVLRVQPFNLESTNKWSRVLKVSWKFRIPTVYNFAVIYMRNLLFSYKVAYFLTMYIVFSVYEKTPSQMSLNSVDLEFCWHPSNNGIRTNAPKENCPQVRIRVGVRVSFRVGGTIFLGSNCLRTLFNCWIKNKEFLYRSLL